MRTKDDNKRRAIRDATIHEVVHSGLHVCSMPKIARRAGISVGTIYVYFKDKQQLFGALYLEIRNEINQALIKAVPTLDKDALRLVWFALLDYLSTHQIEFRFIEVMKSAQVMQENIQTQAPKPYSVIVLEHAVATGLTREGISVEQLSTLLFGPLRTLALSPPESWNTIDAQTIFQALDRGIRA